MTKNRLPDHIVLEIFKAKGVISVATLTQTYNVSRIVVENIFLGDTYNEITGMPRRKRNKKRRLTEGKSEYTYYTRTPKQTIIPAEGRLTLKLPDKVIIEQDKTTNAFSAHYSLYSQTIAYGRTADEAIRNLNRKIELQPRV